MNAHKLSLGLLPVVLTLLLAAHVGVALAGAPGTYRFDIRVSDVDFFLHAPALARDNTMYVGGENGCVYAINPDQDGSIKWIYEASSAVTTNAAVYYSPDGQNAQYDGTIYVGLQEGRVLALDPAGNRKWAFNTGTAVNASPALAADGTIYVGKEPAVLVAIRPNGTQRWAWAVPGTRGITDPVVAPDGTIYFADRELHDLYALAPNRDIKWVVHMEHAIDSPVTIGADGTLYFLGGVYELIALWPSGAPKWRTLAGYTPTEVAPVIGHEGTIYVSTNRLKAFNPDGSPQWEFWYMGHSVNPTASAAVDSSGLIYFPADDGYIYCVATNTGAFAWRYHAGAPEQWLSPSVIGSDGILYSTGDNHVRALYIGAGVTGAFDSSWPVYRRDAQCTARLDKLWSIKNALMELMVFVAQTDLGDRLKRQLTMRLKSAMESLEAGLLLPAVHKLGAFVHFVGAQAGKKIPEELADMLIRDALDILMLADGGHPCHRPWRCRWGWHRRHCRFAFGWRHRSRHIGSHRGQHCDN